MFHHNPIADATTHPSFERPIDLVHLARQTLGDSGLEREILALFVVQAKNILTRLDETVDATLHMELCHTLKGSARAVGAWRVADAAELCEVSVDSAAKIWKTCREALIDAVNEACHSIETVQRAA